MTANRELILGGAGLLGSTLIKELKNRGHETVSLDLKDGCDLRHIDDAPFRNADRVWFLAWDTGGAKYIEAVDSQHEQYRHNCELCARVFDALARTKKPFVFASSQLAGLPTAYGATKSMAANWTLQLGGKVGRLWNAYGWEHPDKRSHVITDLVLAGIQKQRVSCLTNGRERRRFLYKTDTVAALLQLMESPQQMAEIAGSEWVTIGDIANEIGKQLEVPVQLGDLEGSEVMIDPQVTLPGWEPRVTLSEGIARVISDARQYVDNVTSAAGAQSIHTASK